MTLEDECKQLMVCRDEIKKLKLKEKEAKNRILTYLKNHNQYGVIFKHNKKQISITVETTPVKKNPSLKEKQTKIQDILSGVGVANPDATTQEIIDGLKTTTITDTSNQKDVLKLKMGKRAG
ncbi:hypothetical protein MIV102R [Invertebrate iridescent virus 3]|uniref:Uncharacterized protein 102R n=1 Tax=Invertebrate iridescent virus 3 TaxID=345201 RepID=102R_IIV3|nr:hypothetical protein MIV102R [Invertebrate iridescent virus 3]Q196V8.1 RecName: Full=Uncharacterized protein 102R [Invertebrate iridescent virus 3]ABF82132.1 hypothetical protein MIV102R [Invertebrate iridescent virus 3]